MKLVAEVMDMVCLGRTLTARRIVARRGQPIQVSPNSFSIHRVAVNGRYAYEVTDSGEDDCEVTISYADVEQAVWGFAEQVGWIALREAVSDHRYAWLFPAGSTLDWHTRQAQRRAA